MASDQGIARSSLNQNGDPAGLRPQTTGFKDRDSSYELRGLSDIGYIYGVFADTIRHMLLNFAKLYKVL